MYRKILVAVDGSELANAAVAEVERLAGAESEVVLVQVIDSIAHIIAQTTPAGFETQSAGRISVETADQVVAGQRQTAQRYLDETKARLEQAGGASVSTRIVEGLPGTAIVELAAELDCDVIAMATHGRSGVARAVLGSVADYVVRNASAPVLLVRSEGRD
jgi:nucleotide-binding universal stress UspA family protein